MINESELKKVAAMLGRQTHQLADLVSPKAALERGKPAEPAEVIVATADSVGLVCYSLALLITELVGVLHPEAIPAQKGQTN